MRAILLLAILIPLAVGAAAYTGRRIVHALNERARQASAPDRIAQIEAENRRLDDLIAQSRLRDGARRNDQ